LKANLRKAYEAGRKSLRAVRQAEVRRDRFVDEFPEVPESAGGPAMPPLPPVPREHRPAAASGFEPSAVIEAVPRSLQIAAAWSWRLIVVAIVLWGVLRFADQYLILVAPLAIALLLVGLLAPALRWVLTLRLNRSLATLVVLVAGLAVVGGILTLVINQLIDGFDDLRESAEAGVLRIEDWLRGPPLNLSEADLEAAIDQGQDWLNENTRQLTRAGLSAVTGTVQFLTGFVLVLVVTFFFLRDGRRIWGYLIHLLPEAARAPMAYAGEGAWGTLSGYVRATVLVALIDAAGIGIGLWILQVPLAVPLAALVFLGAFVPIVGAFVSGTVAVLVALVDTPAPGMLDGGGVVKALLVLGLILLVQQLEGNVLQPVIMSRAVKIHALAVIIAVTAGILVAGIIGALVAVPVVAVINTVVRRLRAYHHGPPSPPAEQGPTPSRSPSPTPPAPS
jgi:predicted PurR-regulated permease PerM